MKLDDILKLMNAEENPATAMKIAVAFTHVDEELQTSTTFATGVMANSAEIQALEIMLINVDQEFAKFMVLNRGVEKHRLEPLMRKHPVTYPPLLVAVMPPTPSHPRESHLIIDGTHRYVAAAMHNVDGISARIVPEDIWRKYVLEDAPSMSEAEVMAMPSGMDAGGGITAEAIQRVLDTPADHEFFEQLEKIAKAILDKVAKEAGGE